MTHLKALAEVAIDNAFSTEIENICSNVASAIALDQEEQTSMKIRMSKGIKDAVDMHVLMMQEINEIIADE